MQQINVPNVHRHIQRASQSAPIKFQDLVQFLGVVDSKQRRKLDRIVKHLASSNMIVCQGTSIRTRNLHKTDRDTSSQAAAS